MSGMEGLGKILVMAGLALAALGLLITFGTKLGIGRLPGDIFIQKGNFRFYFPIVSSIILSILLTVLFNFINRR
jgi:hypothetical protein